METGENREGQKIAAQEIVVQKEHAKDVLLQLIQEVGE